MWSALSRHDIDPEDPSCSDARRRIRGRLGEYAELLVRPLNMRPTAAALLHEDDERIEVRVSTSISHVVLVIAPDGDLAAEIAWLRGLAPTNLPLPRLIAHDLSCTTVPFTYAIESYVVGRPLGLLADDARVRVAARQVGRTLRRTHQVAAPGWGAPTTTGRWPARTWPDALYGWLERYEILERAEETLGADTTVRLLDATIDHPALACERPSFIHGAVGPARALVTAGETVQLEALARPGALVGGDPMLDLAYGLLPRHPAAFRQGLLESYTVAGPLAAEQHERLRRLSLLALCVDTLRAADPVALARLPEQATHALDALEAA